MNWGEELAYEVEHFSHCNNEGDFNIHRCKYQNALTCGCIDMNDFPQPFLCFRCDGLLCTKCSISECDIDKCSKCYYTMCSYCFREPGIRDTTEFMFSVCRKCARKNG
jgi:hypothetical protein